MAPFRIVSIHAAHNAVVKMMMMMIKTVLNIDSYVIVFVSCQKNVVN